MVGAGFQIPSRLDLGTEVGVVGEQVQHVIEETDPGFIPVPAVEIETPARYRSPRLSSVRFFACLLILFP